MTVQEFAGGIIWPHSYQSTSSIDENNNMTIDAAGEKAAMIFPIPLDGNCIGVSFKTGTVSITAGPLTFVVTLETLDSSGDPSGTLIHANATANLSIADTDDVTTFDVAYTSFAVNGGDKVALVITAPGSGTFSVRVARGKGLLRGNFPHTSLFTASWVNSADAPVMALKYSGDVYHYIPGCYPISSSSTLVFKNTDSPDERGAKFQLPGPVQIMGGWVYAQNDGNLDVVLYDSGDTAQLTYSFIPGDTSGGGANILYWLFDGTFELAANTIARIVVKPGASDIRVYHWGVNIAAKMDAFPGGQNFHQTQRTDAGAWTDNTDQYPLIGLIINGIGDDAGGAGGGGVKLAGHGGGMVG